MKWKSHYFFYVLSGLLALPAQANYQIYGATLEQSRWSADSNPLYCYLRHEIPDYGTAVFSRKPRQALSFTLRVLLAPKRPSHAMLYSEPPPWNHFAHPRQLGSIPVLDSITPFYLNNGWARRLIVELEEGMIPVLRYNDWIDGDDDIKVRISSVNFHDAWREFVECERNLFNYTYEDIRFSVFQYGFNKVELDELARKQLDRIAEYVKVDPDIEKIRIDGYTDSKGFSRINIKVARRRANAVKQYLLNKGIPASMLKTHAHSEKNAKFSNRTRKGRDMNRRVEVTVYK